MKNIEFKSNNTKENKEDKISTKILSREDLFDIIYKETSEFPDRRFSHPDKGGVFKYFDVRGGSIFSDGTHYPIISAGDKIIGIGELKQDPYNDKNFWIQHISIDPEYEGMGNASKLAESIFAFAKEIGYSVETSSYTDVGFQKLKPLFNKLAEEYGVEFIDKGKL